MADSGCMMDSRSVPISDVSSVVPHETDGHIARQLCVVQDVVLYRGMSFKNRKMPY